MIRIRNNTDYDKYIPQITADDLRAKDKVIYPADSQKEWHVNLVEDGKVFIQNGYELQCVSFAEIFITKETLQDILNRGNDD